MSMLRVDAVVDGSHHVESTDDAAGDLDGNRNSLMRKENGNDDSSSPDQRQFEKELEAAQQKAFERFTSMAAGFHPTFPIAGIPPFLAALQQNPLALRNHLMGLTSASPPESSMLDDDVVSNDGESVEPEDLSVRPAVVSSSTSATPANKSTSKASSDPPGDDGLTPAANDAETGSQQNWSYEEQFKQLYELSDEPKRKEWLDDWLSFMHRIGKPVTRIPIMAKQVLDLYELYRLVVQHGGLVEIINKKLWREITKGLNLPSSITSAAFTLRTQYQKFLYDYECEKEGLSTPADLQQAIDGNRREGRRNNSASSFPGINFSLNHAPTLLGKHMNGGLNLRDDDANLGGSTASTSQQQQQAVIAAAYRAEQLAALEAQRQFERAQRWLTSCLPTLPQTSSDACRAAVEAVVGRHSQQQRAPSGRASTSSNDSDIPPVKRGRASSGIGDEAAVTAPINPMERLFGGMSSAHLKITNGRSGMESSLVVSMEINGVMYQGVLFALNPGQAGATNPLRIHASQSLI